MADYSRYKTETLVKMRDRAYEKYCAETTKPQGNWGDGMRLAKLPTLSAWEKARERYFAIDAELKRRKLRTKSYDQITANLLAPELCDGHDR